MSAFIQEGGGAMAPAEKRGRGRPPKIASANPATASGANLATATADVVDRPAQRQRKPFGSQSQKLAYSPRANYHRHWFNDVPGRLQQASEAGYEHVKDDKGESVMRPVGTNPQGGVQFAYLMEIPQEWYDEDMAAEQSRINASEQAIAGGVVLNSQGERQGVFTNTAQGRRTSIKHGVR